MAKSVKPKYSNGFSLSTNQLDARILFTLTTSEIVNGENTDKFIVEDVADIRMSAGVLRQLYQIIGESLAKLEPTDGQG